MGVIEEVRQKRRKLADVLSDEEYGGIRQVVEDLYPDTAHFIYELLQNAEDAGATEAAFTLSGSVLVFEHNGRPFDKRDVEGITNIGKGSKAGAVDKIGRFGIGFKAVFAYSETPYIWSPTYCFKITDLVLPTSLDSLPELNGRTRFEFPFNSRKKGPEEAGREVASGLNQIGPMTLLFLSHLKVIRWESGGKSAELRRVQHSENHVTVVKQVGRKKTKSHFLLFEQSVNGLETKRAAVAFELGFQPKFRHFDPHRTLAEQLRVVPATPGRVAVYFPAEKETSGLRFHLHAPFVPELSRASIKETRANDPLFEQLATLTAGALHRIRDLGLLTPEFLAVLPNPQDSVPERYQCIRAAVIDEMRTRPLTPTHSKSHEPAKHLCQAKVSLKRLLSDEDLEFLLNDKPRHWAMAPTQKNSDIDRFLDGLELERWDIDDFVGLLKEKASPQMWTWQPPVDERFMTWLSSKPAALHQRMYATLYEELRDKLAQLTNVQIVRLSNGTYAAGEKCFFPTDGVEHDQTHPRVAADVFTSGNNKTEQAHARKFLEGLGVREVGEAEQVQVILDQRYSKDAEIPDQKTHLRDLKRFIKLVEDDSGNAKLFTDYWILEGEGAWCQPSQVFLDKPFLETGLRAFYDALPEKSESRRWALAKHYGKCRIANTALEKFCKAVGVETELTVESKQTSSHPSKSELQKDLTAMNWRPETMVDEDWWIPGLEEVLRRPSKPLANLLWKTFARLESKHLKARFRPNRQFQIREEPSSLVLLLRKHRWILQGRNEFVCPADASRKRLPKDFDFDLNWPWLAAIGFADNDDKRRDERRAQREMAKKLGFPDWAACERALRFIDLPREEQQRFLDDVERRRTNGDRKSDNERSGAGGRPGTRSANSRVAARTLISPTDGPPRLPTEEHHAERRVSKSNQRQFISYVAVEPEQRELDPDGLGHEARMTLEEKAIDLILSREPSLQRTPKNNPGFDLFEENDNGQQIRWVEVKAMTGRLEDRPVGMSHTQFKRAQVDGSAYWLYVVENAGDDMARIVRIQDPAGKAKTFTFDHGWLGVAEVTDTDGTDNADE